MITSATGPVVLLLLLLSPRQHGVSGKQADQQDGVQRAGVISRLCSLLSADQLDFINRLQRLDEEAQAIAAFAPQFDFYPGIQENGFRSVVKVIDLFFQQVDKNAQRLVHRDSQLSQDYAGVLSLLERMVVMSRLAQLKGPAAIIQSPVQTAIDVTYGWHLVSVPVRDRAALSRSLIGFQYTGILSSVSKSGLLSMATSFTPLAVSRFASSTSGAIDVAPSTAVVKMVMPVYLSRPLDAGAVVGNGMHGCITMRLAIPRINPHVITLPPDLRGAAYVRRVDDPSRRSESETGQLTVLMVKQVMPLQAPSSSNSSSSKNAKSVMLLLHGSGFVTSISSFSAERAASISRLLNMPVLVVGYRKAPEHQFPASLQDILDVYLFLTSGHPQVQVILGFHPEKVFLSGDSSGGGLAVGLSILLSMIAKSTWRQGDPAILMPSGIMTQYIGVTPGFLATPSLALSAIDVILSPGFIAYTSSMYAAVRPPVNDSSWLLESVSREQKEEIISRYAYRLQDPLYNNLAFRGWHEFSNIPLTLVVGDVDPVLDQSLLLARCWRGPVRLDVLTSVPHGFVDLLMDPGMSQAKETYERHLLIGTGVQAKK